MIKRKSDRKMNRGRYTKTGLCFGRMVGTVWMAAVFAFAGCFALSAMAAPAALGSSDATVYEQANEGSNPVGNLVEGSTFEYTGDVTAEDGSVWHQITTAGGATGYIKGDREIEIREEEPASEEQGEQEAPAGEGGEPETAENEPDEAADGIEGNTGENTGDNPAGEDGEVPAGDGGDALEENDGEDEETPEEGDRDMEEEPEDGNILAAINMQNNRKKNYALSTSEKIKDRGTFTRGNSGIPKVEGKKTGLDMTLIIGITVVLFCAEVIYTCLVRIKRLKWETEEGGTWDTGKSRIHKKAEKKKRSQKRKVKKAVQSRKENGKAPKITGRTPGEE